jgi:hypothetical protein
MTLATVTESSVTTTTTDAPTFATVDAKAFAGLLTDVVLFASKIETLPGLCAVQLQRGTVDGKAVIVARSTDRYALAEGWVHCDGATVWPEATILIPTDGVKQILGVLKGTPRGGMAIVTVTKDDKRGVLTINVDNFRAQATVICSDGCFPSGVKSLWPSGSDVVPAVRAFGPTIMARPAAVAKRRSEPLRIHWDGKHANGGVLMSTGQDFRVLIMTYRDDAVGYAFAEPSYS